MSRASKSKSRASRKPRKKQDSSVDSKEARLAKIVHDYLTGHEPVVASVSLDEYLDIFKILGLLNRNAKGQQVSAAARSKDRLKRMAAAMHPAATKGTLEKLADDSEQVIRDQALLRLAELS